MAFLGEKRVTSDCRRKLSRQRGCKSFNRGVAKGDIPGERQKCKSSSFRAVFTYKLYNSFLLALISKRLTMPNIMEMLCKYFLHCTP